MNKEFLDKRLYDLNKFFIEILKNLNKFDNKHLKDFIIKFGR